MSTHNIGFYEDLTKLTFKISSNTHLISSSGPDWKLPKTGFLTMNLTPVLVRA